MNVLDARVRRAVDREGIRCCEVEVRTDHAPDSELLVYFGGTGNNDFDMIAIVRNDADTAIDWFDNNLHDAFADMSAGLFETNAIKTDWGQREIFKERVLSYPGVRAEIGRLMRLTP